MGALPSSAEQFRALKGQLPVQTPQVAAAKQKSDTLAHEAAALRARLIDTAARIEQLERDEIDQDARIAVLQGEVERLNAGFLHDRVAVTHLIAVLERLQHDMPPALALRPDDALAAARGSMLIGASLPPVYARAAALSHRIAELARNRAELARQRVGAQATQKSLSTARITLAALVTQKEEAAAQAAGTYDDMKAQLAEIAAKAADFQTLLSRIAKLRKDSGSDNGVVTVSARTAGLDVLAKGALRLPVVGTMLPPGAGPTPGASIVTLPNAQVIAPADGKVLFAGPYHKSGQVLILEITTGYDLVLAGLGRVTVKPNDELLAGEPVGAMPAEGADQRLYFELRRDGKADWIPRRPGLA